MKLVPSGMQNVVEVTYEFVDKGITRDVIGSDATRFTPFLGSLFLFVLFLNIWEIIPGLQFPPTSRIAIPMFLALMVYVLYWFLGFKHQGMKYLTGHLFPPGVPWPLYMLLTPIEFIQIAVVRPFSLAVRLFANMMAGHILLTALGAAHVVRADERADHRHRPVRPERRRHRASSSWSASCRRTSSRC